MSKRQAALELLKKSRERGESLVKSYKSANADDIYEEIDEADYQNIVKHRQKEESFVVDDDGCGYVDDGLEVWDHTHRNDGYEGSDDETGRTSKVQDSKKKRSVLEGTSMGNKDISELFQKAANNNKKSNAVSIEGGKDFLNSLFETDSLEGVNFKNKKSRPSQRMSTTTTTSSNDGGRMRRKIDVDSILEANNKPIDFVEPMQSGFDEELPREQVNLNKPDEIEIPSEHGDEFDDEFFSPEELELIQQSDGELNPFNSVVPEHKEIVPLPIDNLKAVNLIKEEEITPMEITNQIPSCLPSDSEIKFYWIDLQEKPNSSSLFLLGKLYNGTTDKRYVNSCLVITNIEKSIYFLPKEDAEPDQLMKEIDQLMIQNKIKNYRKKIVSRKYAFEIANVPEEADYVKVVFPHCSLHSIPAEGKFYSHVFGLSTSTTESFLIKRKIMGPCWLTLQSPIIKDSSSISWYSSEIEVTAKHVVPSIQGNPDDPSIDAVALDFKTVINQKTKTHEIVAANLLFFKGINPNQTNQNHPCTNSIKIIRHIDGITFPVRFQEHFHNKGFGRIEVAKTERILLGKICKMLNVLDPDILIGHNILNFDLDILLNRIKECKCEDWARLGRIKFSQLPKSSISSEFVIKQLFNGRLICDTYLASKELVKSKLYSLESLAHSELNLTRPVLDDERIVEYYQNIDSLCYLINHNENDSLLSAKLAFQIGIVPLSKQLTILAGNLWWRTLNGARSERNEYLLLHEFHNAKYIVPDKRNPGKHITVLADGGGELENESAPGTTSSKRKAAYAGGLVLEPKKGLYDKIILLLDFNSLYPSIIQEYNICFTTVQRALHDFSDDNLPNLPDKSIPIGILPKLLANLVARRRQVKSLMKENGITESQLHELEIRQKALKLTANSMYGCLGFVYSRFYAKELAMLITAKGREILQNTVEIAQQQCHLDVIYGDTDSVMINTGCATIGEAKKLGYELKRAVNERYKLVEIEIDGIFNRLLLLKKKKYAALVYDERTQQNTLEMKGLDLVRRDWCNLSVDCCSWVLNQIMRRDIGKEEVVEKIHEYLEQVSNSVRAGQVGLDKFVINKNLTKNPQEYTDKHTQPHVQVAIRMIEGGKFVKPGDIIPYVICKSTDSSTLLAQNAYHPEDVRRNPSTLLVDNEWYLCQQIHPPIARLCQYIEGTDNAHLAVCLGLDSGKYSTKYGGGGDDDDQSNNTTLKSSIPSYISYFTNNNNDFVARIKLTFQCSYCQSQNEINREWTKSCTNCGKVPLIPTVYMGIIKYTKQLQQEYYLNRVRCDDRLCGYSSTSINLSNSGMSCPNCQGSLNVVFGEKDCYFHLKYLYELFRKFNDDSCLVLCSRIDKLIDEISFRTVRLDSLFSFLSLQNTGSLLK